MKSKGLYISTKDMIDRDFISIVCVFDFSHGQILSGTVQVEGGIIRTDLARRSLKQTPTRNPSSCDGLISFDLNYYPGLWSKWMGWIMDGGSRIAFSIVDADHQEIGGLYEFVPYEVAEYAPR